jgi:hypothetical protein
MCTAAIGFVGQHKAIESVDRQRRCGETGITGVLNKVHVCDGAEHFGQLALELVCQVLNLVAGTVDQAVVELCSIAGR